MAEITIQDQKYKWKNGEDILFDDTFTHSVKNLSDKPRIILFCDILTTTDSKTVDYINKLACYLIGAKTYKLNSKHEK